MMVRPPLVEVWAAQAPSRVRRAAQNLAGPSEEARLLRCGATKTASFDQLPHSSLMPLRSNVQSSCPPLIGLRLVAIHCAPASTRSLPCIGPQGISSAKGHSLPVIRVYYWGCSLQCMGLQGAPSGVKPSPVSSSISCLREVKGGSSVLTKRMVSLGWSPTVHTVQPCSDGDTCAGLMRPPRFVPNWGSRACPKPLHIA